MSPDRLSVTLRALSLVLLYQACGAAFFLAVMHGRVARSAGAIRRLACTSALAGLVLVAAHGTLEAARLAGDYAGMIEADMLRLAWLSGNGAAHVAQMIGLGLIVIAFATHRASGGSRLLATLGAAIAALALTLTGHSRTHAAHGLFPVLLALHLLIVAFWFGALWPLAMVLRAEPRAAAATVIARFSSLATPLVPLILVAGVGMAWLLIDDRSVFRRPYGLLLLAKLAGFALLLPLAAFNKWRLTPALQSGVPAAATTLRRIVVAEFVLICAVLTVTANLTAFYSPEG
jgi:putative copper export protein